MKISRRAGIDLMPRTNHRVIPGAPGLYAAENRSVPAWFNSGLGAIARGFCHAPCRQSATGAQNRSQSEKANQNEFETPGGVGAREFNAGHYRPIRRDVDRSYLDRRTV